MKVSKTELISYYKNTLQEIEQEKRRLDIERIEIENKQSRLIEEEKEKYRERIKDGTATIFEHYEFLLKTNFNYLIIENRRELNSLFEKARELAIEIWGEDRAFPTISDFLKASLRRIKKLIKYLLGKPKYCNQSIEDKRPLIAQFRKLLIKVNRDDVDNSTTQIKNIINRVLNFHIKQNGYVIRYKKINYQHLIMRQNEVV